MGEATASFGASAMRLAPPSGADVFARLAPIAVTQRLANGAGYVAQPETDILLCLVTGAAKLVAQSPGGTAQVVAFHFAGDCVSLPAHSLFSYRLVALQPCELQVLPQAEALKALGGDAKLVAQLLGRAITSLQGLRDHTVLLGRRSASERVAGFLMELAERAGHLVEGAIVTLPMQRRDIADFLGLTVETVSRQFSALRRAGLIETPSRARIRVIQPALLAALTGHLAPAQ